MKIHRPLWAEGTFLSSQQFQQQARWEAFSNDCIAQLCIRHPWGIANVLFDRDALTPGKLKTQAVRLRFADGTLIDSDVSDVLPLACDLRALKNDSAIVLLALPLAHGNGGNLGQGEQTERPLRYRQEWQKVQDIYGSDSEDMVALSVMRCPCALLMITIRITSPAHWRVWCGMFRATGHRMRAIFRRYWRLTPMTGWYSVWTHCCCSYGRSASV